MRDLFVWLDLRLLIRLAPSMARPSERDEKHARAGGDARGVRAPARPIRPDGVGGGTGAGGERSDRGGAGGDRPAAGRKGGADIPLLRLFERCGLDAFEQNCVILAYAAVLDRKYEKLLAYLQDDMTRKSPGVALAVQLFLPKGGDMEQYLARFAWQGRFPPVRAGRAGAGRACAAAADAGIPFRWDDRGPAGIDGVRRGGGPPGRPAHVVRGRLRGGWTA